jgi:hypothetical protein
MPADFADCRQTHLLLKLSFSNLIFVRIYPVGHLLRYQPAYHEGSWAKESRSGLYAEGGHLNSTPAGGSDSKSSLVFSNALPHKPMASDLFFQLQAAIPGFVLLPYQAICVVFGSS